MIVSASPQDLLASGGDGRLSYGSDDGLNRYGSSLVPREHALAFASSTASTPTLRAFTYIERLCDRWQRAARAGRSDIALADAAVSLKHRIRFLCGLGFEPGAEVVLTASGTEAQMIAVTLALAEPEQPATIVLVGPGETGSNVVDAVLGRHFSSRTTLGVSVRGGAPIAGLPFGKVELQTVHLREESGLPREAEEIDAEVADRVRAAIAARRRPVLCMVDSSKTGIMAPSPRLALALKAQFQNALDVIVDACQMRLSRQRLGWYLASGFVVTVSGSKFFGAPPFCGAVLVPPKMARQCRERPPLAAGLRDYTWRGAWPEGWTSLCGGLPREVPLGVLLRWEAATLEMARFQALPASMRARTVAFLTDAVSAAFTNSVSIEPVPVTHANPFRRPSARSWDRLQTIFPFHVHTISEDDRRLLTPEAAKSLHNWLNEDLGHHAQPGASARDRDAWSTPCHLGQPVALPVGAGRFGGALRLTLGASTIADVVEQGNGSSTFEDRLQDAARDIETAVRKTDLIVERLGRGERAFTIPTSPERYVS